MSPEPLFVWRFATAEFDEGSRELRVDGQLVDLEPRPLELLLQLLRHAQEAVTKEDLLDAVYGHRHVSDGALAQAIRRLRRALNDDAQLIISTVHRIGYKLTATVSRREIAGPRLHTALLRAGDGVPGRAHWKLLQALGAGEIDVWLIEHEKTHARRVLKLCSNASRLSALKREVTLSRVLKDSLGERPDLVPVLDWNFEVRPYFVEFAFGGICLLEWAAARGGLAAIPLSERIAMLIAVADAVAAAHSADVLHKDLKPANILAEQQADQLWRPRLIDFGSGHLLDVERLEALRITQQGFTHQLASGEDAPTGTALYLSPELLAGQMPTVQSDVYALGVILYQLAAADFRKPMTSGWEDDIADPWLRADIAFATHGNPAKRMTTARELAQRLRSLDARRAAPAAPKSSHRRKLLAAACAALVAMVVWFALARSPAGTSTSSASPHAEANEAYAHALIMTHRQDLKTPDWLELIQSLQRAVAVDPSFAKAWALLSQQYAHLYFNHYNPEASRLGASHALEQATKLQPDSPETLIASGYFAYWVDADYVGAARLMHRVHDTSPDSVDATIALAWIARRQCNYADAASYFEESLAKNRLDLGLVLGAGWARLALQDFSAALKLANLAIEISPNDVQSLGFKATVYQQLGDLHTAKSVLASLPNRPGNFEAVELRAEQARLERNYPVAIGLWETYLASPESPSVADSNSAHIKLGHVLWLEGKHTAATAALEHVRRELNILRAQQPSDPRHLAQLALVYSDLGEADLARRLANSAATLNVTTQDAIRNGYYEEVRARVAARTGDKDQAFASLHRLLMPPFIGRVAPRLLPLDPDWDGLRDDARFRGLLESAATAARL